MDFFRSQKKPTTAAMAKERLQIIVAHERGQRNRPDYLPQLQRDILEVIRKYVPISEDQVQVDLDSQGNCSVLELNITLPDR
ncbi:UNVERIFIED_CONTAM: minE [Trichonephila clavipes]